MRTKSGGKVVYRTFDGYHLWGNSEVFPDVEREVLMSSAQGEIKAVAGHPIVYEQGKPPLSIEMIECGRCRRNVERDG